MVREAKTYDRASSPGNTQQATELAGLLARFIQQHPTYQRAEVLTAVPPSNTEKAFDLPSLLVAEVARQTGQHAAPTALRKVRGTRPMKDCQTVQEKVDNLKDAFEAEPAVFRDKAVIILDDIYQSGFSINEVGRAVRLAGARLVLGLTATKTGLDLSEDQQYEV